MERKPAGEQKTISMIEREQAESERLSLYSTDPV